MMLVMMESWNFSPVPVPGCFSPAMIGALMSVNAAGSVTFAIRHPLFPFLEDIEYE